MTHKRLALILPFITFLASCAGIVHTPVGDVVPVTGQLVHEMKHGHGMADGEEDRSDSYIIGKGDSLLVKIFVVDARNQQSVEDLAQLVPVTNSPNVTSGFQVKENGAVNLPYVGRVNVAGKTLGEAQEAIEEKLSELFRDPVVELQVEQYVGNKVFVMGEVRKPGTRTLGVNGMYLIDALGGAEGLNLTTANTSHIYVLRSRDPFSAEAKNISPAQKELPRNMTIYHLDGSELSGIALAGEFPMRNRDIVYVSTAPITDWSRFISQVFPNSLLPFVANQY